MGPPGSGKSFLGCELAEQGVAAFIEAHIAEVDELLWRSYCEQIRESELVVALESNGVSHRNLLEDLQGSYRVALVHVDAARELCIARVVTRALERNTQPATDRETVGRFYDAWRAQIAPTYAFDLAVDGADVDHASAGIRSLLG